MKLSRLFAIADIRDQPRMAAAVILGVGNIGSGVTGLMSSNKGVASLTFVARSRPLSQWWIAFIVLGAIILFGPLSPRIALISALIALGTRLMFTSYVWRAHTHLFNAYGQHQVSLHGVWDIGWLTVLHVLLTPYLRRRRGAPCPATT